MKPYSVVLFVLSCAQMSLSQQTESALESSISAYVRSQDSSAELEKTFDIDTLLAHASDINLFLDKSNKLDHFILFFASAQADSENFSEIGLYRKDGTTKWISNPVIGSNMGRVLSIQDLNRDGDPEIVTDWIMGASGAVSHIWILSWDGSAGIFLNDFDKEGYSDIYGTFGSFFVEDVNSDGIMEITGDQDSSRVIYTWNGTKYTRSSVSLPADQEQFGKASNFSMSLSCGVVDSMSTYIYSYSMTNNASSLQGINSLSLKASIANLKSTTDNEWKFGTIQVESLATFTTIFSGTLLPPGRTASSMNMESSGLPGIAEFYAQGQHRTPVFEPSDITNHISEFVNDIYKNSVHGLTIGPRIWAQPISQMDFLDTLTSYTTQSRSLGWIKDQATADKYSGYFSSAKTSLQQNNTAAARTTLQQVIQQVNVDSASNLTSEAYALIRYNTEYLLTQLPTAQPGFIVKLTNSTGARLTTGSLQYYEGSWKNAASNNDGTFTINTTAKTLSLRMTYEYGSQTKYNVTVGSDTALFQTVSAQIKLQDSKGNPIDTGTVQYYAGAWRNLGATTNGIASKELLPNNYTFRMTYAYGNNDKAQDIGMNPTVVFQTVNAAVELQDSRGSAMDTGAVLYYAGAWRSLGTTSSGVATKELLPNNYSFRMIYAYGSNDKQQNIGTNPTVVFQTVNATVQLKNSQGNLIDQGSVQYYAGAWRNFGTTSNGITSRELLPNTYPFSITYEGVSNDKQQDISANSTVAFSTVLCTVRVTNSQNQPVDNVQASYYAGAWRQIGSTLNGQVTKELLPANLTFRITYGANHQDKTQNLSANNMVEFSIP